MMDTHGGHGGSNVAKAHVVDAACVIVPAGQPGSLHAVDPEDERAIVGARSGRALPVELEAYTIYHFAETGTQRVKNWSARCELEISCLTLQFISL
jgi:hypothetical protein